MNGFWNILSPKKAITLLAGTTGVVAPTAVAGQKAGEVSELKKELCEIKDLESQIADLEEKNEELIDSKKRIIETYQTLYKQLTKRTREESERNKQLAEDLKQEKKRIWGILKSTFKDVNERDFNEWLRFLGERCDIQYCDVNE